MPPPLHLLPCLAVLLLPAIAAQTAYNPTRLLRAGSLLYVFQPSPQASTQFQLRAVNLTTSFSAAHVPYTTLDSTLPFLDTAATRAFTPLLDNGGNLTVYTGDCAHGADGGQLWSFTPDPTSDTGTGTWTREDVSVQSSRYHSSMGANYLSAGVAFSSTVGGGAASTNAYIFGGMCPNQTDSSSSWQAAASYSNLMVSLQPSSMRGSTLSYNLDLSPGRGPPIPEAGFTMTALTPTFSNRSDGTQTQQQNFVLLGGHTSTAFINMSQIALFSLPEQSWTFVGVQQPDPSQTNLATRTDISTIDPRSGHTAILTPDGQHIIVIGGWVGDVYTPAVPQFAVLNVANGYGGQGEWEWTMPTTSGAGIPDHTGLYGHGAAMLPGGILMVTGGYAISAPSSRSRRATPTSNTKAYFLNVTSHTWITDYSPPPEVSQPAPVDSHPLSTPGEKVGLGVGLGVGVAAICGLFAFYMWYTRRLKRQREVREKQLQDMGFTAHRFNAEMYSPGVDAYNSHSDTPDYLAIQSDLYYFPQQGARGGKGWRAASGGDAERTGLLVEIPSPTRGLRRSISGRPAYAMGRARGPGQIHPIDELEEEPDEGQAQKATLQSGQAEMAETDSGKLLGAPILDPFTDAHGYDNGHRTVSSPSLSSPFARWTSQADSTLPNYCSQGFDAMQEQRSPAISEIVLPEKLSSERTSSNLSESSTRSNLSWTSSGAGIIRSASMHSTAAPNHTAHGNPFNTPSVSPTRDRPRRNSEVDRHTPVDPRTQSLKSNRSTGLGDSDTAYASPSSFPHLQAEGEALLGGNPERPRPGTASSHSNAQRGADGNQNHTATAAPITSHALESSAIMRPITRERRRSWLGSVRKVLTRSASGAERTRSLTTSTFQHEPYRDSPPSPVEHRAANTRKSFPAADVPPRRAASDASFWRNKRGQQDWLEDEQDPTWRRNAGDDWGAPEDVALAERERQRQEWRERGTRLVNINDVDQQLPTPRTPIGPEHLGIPTLDNRPRTPASESDWDVEAAVERRVVQVMFTIPKSKLRVVNADIDQSSILSLPSDGTQDSEGSRDPMSSPSSRVRDLASRFEQRNSPKSSPRASPRPSPSPSIRSMKIRPRPSTAPPAE